MRSSFFILFGVSTLAIAFYLGNSSHFGVAAEVEQDNLDTVSVADYKGRMEVPKVVTSQTKTKLPQSIHILDVDVDSPAVCVPDTPCYTDNTCDPGCECLRVQRPYYSENLCLES